MRKHLTDHTDRCFFHARKRKERDEIWESFIKFLGENRVSIFRFDNEQVFLDELANA